MIGTRFLAALALSFVLALPAVVLGDGNGLFGRRSKTDPARVRQLLEIIRSSPDEKKRRAAVADLAAADPRLQTEVIPTIVAALRKDNSVAVRVAAAELLGTFNVAFPTGGLALEDAVETDPSPLVRAASEQALWQYHVNGYRSARGVKDPLGQTAEPPFARPARGPEPLTSEPPTAAVDAAAAPVPTPTISPLPPIGPAPSPRVPGPDAAARTGSLPVSTPPHPNLTVEPPLARIVASRIAGPAATPEPPIRIRWPEPVSVGKAPPIALDLPSIVPDPGPIPGVTPFPQPTGEPPIARPARVLGRN